MKKHLPGERVVEVPWLLTKLGKPKRILDIGSAFAAYLEDLVATGAEEAIALDTRKMKVPFGVQTRRGSVTEMPEEWTNHFDLVTCISTIDHIGLKVYGNEVEENLLERSVKEILRVVSPGGRLLLTVPFGKDCITHESKQRVFGLKALQELFPIYSWYWREIKFWRLVSGKGYQETTYLEVKDAGFAKVRAAACVAIVLQKRAQKEAIASA